MPVCPHPTSPASAPPVAAAGTPKPQLPRSRGQVQNKATPCFLFLTFNLFASSILQSPLSPLLPRSFIHDLLSTHAAHLR
eukprot:161299-Chlamydomonas_euryale.AAC.1